LGFAQDRAGDRNGFASSQDGFDKDQFLVVSFGG
jgi:hypothetical protein